MNAISGQPGSTNVPQADRDNIDIFMFLNSLGGIRAESEAALDRVAGRLEQYPERIAKMRAEVPGGDQMNLRELIVNHTTRTATTKEKLDCLQCNAHEQARKAVPEVF
ncbi:hypothetical protein KAZ92_00770 [Candidatus Gracilibacteria bacterium]|nr:hypothetical protein [Candidatus Gracilibacteria bacterium]